MGLRKKWAFDKVDWDERIRNNEVVFRNTFVQDMNDSELVEILNLRGVRAHRGMDRDELMEVFELSLQGRNVEIKHPVDFLRRRLVWFTDMFWHKIRDQVDASCERNCFDKPDAEVLTCYTAPGSAENIEKEMKKHGYED